jgi:hypothetical protein
MNRFGARFSTLVLASTLALVSTAAQARGKASASYQLEDGRLVLQTARHDTVVDLSDQSLRVVTSSGLAVELPSASLDGLSQKSFRPFGGSTSSLVIDITTVGFSVHGLVAEHVDDGGALVRDTVSLEELNIGVSGLVIDITTAGYRLPIRTYSVSGLVIDLPSSGVHGYIGETEKNLEKVVLEMDQELDPTLGGTLDVSRVNRSGLVIDLPSSGLSTGGAQSEDIPCSISGLVIDLPSSGITGFELPDGLTADDLMLDDLVIDLPSSGVSTGGSGGEDRLVLDLSTGGSGGEDRVAPSGLVIDITTAGVSTGGSGGEDRVMPDTLVIDLPSSGVSTGGSGGEDRVDSDLSFEFADRLVGAYPLAQGSLADVLVGDESAVTQPPIFPGPIGGRDTLTFQGSTSFSKSLRAPSSAASNATVVAVLGGRHIDVYQDTDGAFVLEPGADGDFAVSVLGDVLAVELFQDDLIIEVDATEETLTLMDEDGAVLEQVESFYKPLDAESLDVSLRFEATSEEELAEILSGYADDSEIELDNSLDLFVRRVELALPALTSLAIADEQVGPGAASRFDLQLDLIGVDIDQIDLDSVVVDLDATDSIIGQLNLGAETDTVGHALVLENSELGLLDTTGTVERIQLIDAAILETDGGGVIERIVE